MRKAFSYGSAKNWAGLHFTERRALGLGMNQVKSRPTDHHGKAIIISSFSVFSTFSWRFTHRTSLMLIAKAQIIFKAASGT